MILQQKKGRGREDLRLRTVLNGEVFEVLHGCINLLIGVAIAVGLRDRRCLRCPGHLPDWRWG